MHIDVGIAEADMELKRQVYDVLRFRDVLKADETLRTRYANLKKALQEQFSQDRKAYTASKHAFIRDLLQQNKV